MHVSRIAPELAAQALAGMAHQDPRGMLADGDIPGICDRGQCFELAGPAARAVYVLDVHNGVAWVQALAGQGSGVDLVAVTDAAICAQSIGLRRVALQTARRGLVRRLQPLGYSVTGWIMGKDIQ